jgi:hypothetical protein
LEWSLEMVRRLSRAHLKLIVAGAVSALIICTVVLFAAAYHLALKGLWD